MTDLSIIIVNYNTAELTRNCINSIINTSTGIDYEIILVDNASGDRSIEHIRDELKITSLQCIFNSENRGFAKANNQGIRISKGRHILLLNSDTVVLDDCLLKVLKFAESRPDVGIVGCKVLNPDMTLQYSCSHYPNVLTELVFFTKGIIKNFCDPVTCWKYMKYWNHLSIRSVDSISGCFFWVKKEVFEKAGLLDENIFMYYEDTEFCWRVQKLTNYTVMYYPHARIIHLQGVSATAGLKPTVIKYCFMASLYYFEKNMGRVMMLIFLCMCHVVWRIERQFFLLFSKYSTKACKKAMLLKELMRS